MTENHEAPQPAKLKPIAWVIIGLCTIPGFVVICYLGYMLFGVGKPQATQSTTPTSSYSAPSQEATTSEYQENHGSEDCTDDCSGHEAGYEYAEENDICDTEYSDGNSDSFNEGVIAWSEDNC